MHYQKLLKYFILSLCCLIINNSYASDESNPCNNSFISIINRPTVANSACVVPYKKAVFELGYQLQHLIITGHQQNFPQAEFRLGLANQNELVLSIPNYIEQSIEPNSGFNYVTVGIKHEFKSTKNLIFTMESLTILPSGSDAFGSSGLGEAINAIISYDITRSLNFSVMFGDSNTTQANILGGQRFNSINPDAIISWSASNNFSIYAEIYGQSKTAPDEGSGYNGDVGIIYLLQKNLAVDFELAQRINGNLGGFEHYIGIGVSVEV